MDVFNPLCNRVKGQSGMINKKICMLGSFSVGKTSMVQQFVYSLFSDNYLSTVGVKISKKQLSVDGTDLNLVLWDLEGQDDFYGVNTAYLKGAMGALLVIDGTRQETLATAISLRQTMLDTVGDIPHLFLINKADMQGMWEIKDSDLAPLEASGAKYLKTSAKTGENVEEAFTQLARAMLEKDHA